MTSKFMQYSCHTNYTGIEIKTINSLGSWNGGILVMVTGSVKIKDFSSRRKFAHTFFLATQEKGYFVLNDTFQFIDDDTVYQDPAPIMLENKFDTQVDASTRLPEQPVSNYDMEEEARKYVNSVHIEDDPVDKYNLSEEQQQEDSEAEIVEKNPAKETPLFQTNVNTV